MIGSYSLCHTCHKECQIIGDISSKGERKSFCCLCWKEYFDKDWSFECPTCEKRNLVIKSSLPEGGL